MRVLVITNYFPPQFAGGAELSAYNTCLGLVGRGIEVSVLVVNARERDRVDRLDVAQPPGDRGLAGAHTVQGLTFPVHRVTYQTPWLNHALLQTFDPRVYRAVLAELRRVQPDLVHVHNVSGATLAPFVACHRLGVPVVLTLHDHWLLCPNNMLYRGDGSVCDPAVTPSACAQCFKRYDFWADIPRRRQVLEWLVRHVCLLISPSRRLVELHTAAGYACDRFRVVPYGIYPGGGRLPTDPMLREYAQEKGSHRTLLFAGAVVESKGLQTLIDSLPFLDRYVERLRFLVAGWGDERFLSALRRADPLVVKVLGRVPFQEMRALYAAADLTVVPSIWYDNSPMVIYESLLAGTPVLGSDIGGIPELIQPGQTGDVFPPGDVFALVEGVIQHFSRSAPERRRMRHRCVKYVHDHLTMEHHLDRLQQVYDEALGQNL
jgi:glycosyltransferase involved in cell wall biosynthesis